MKHGRATATVSERRARLVVQCACEWLGIDPATAASELRLPLSVGEFELELRNRFGAAHPDLVFRTDSTLERARLHRRGLPGLPKVILRQGAPPRGWRKPVLAVAAEEGQGSPHTAGVTVVVAAQAEQGA